MRIQNVQLTHFAASVEECPNRPLPDFALSGRSNVGKSSLVNLLTRRKGIAYTSKQPGKTQVLTYYEVDERFYLVDMPGYGFAKVGEHQRRQWAAQSKKYFHQREQLAGIIQLIDIRVGPTPDDRARLRDVATLGKPICLAMTKCDKIPKGKWDATVGRHLAGLDVRLPADTAVVLTSATAKFGHDQVLAWIEDQLAARRGQD